jgi:hypothetical protein
MNDVMFSISTFGTLLNENADSARAKSAFFNRGVECYSGINSKSVRRFLDLPSSVLLLATGLSGPLP